MLQGPSKAALEFASHSPGIYITGTIAVCVSVMLGASIWEVIDLGRTAASDDAQCVVLVCCCAG